MGTFITNGCLPLHQDSQGDLQSTGEEEHCTGEEEALEVHRQTWKHPGMLGEGLSEAQSPLVYKEGLVLW